MFGHAGIACVGVGLGFIAVQQVFGLGDILHIGSRTRQTVNQAGVMDYYNRQRPHTFNDGMPPVVAEEKLKILSGIS